MSFCINFGLLFYFIDRSCASTDVLRSMKCVVSSYATSLFYDKNVSASNKAMIGEPRIHNFDTHPTHKLSQFEIIQATHLSCQFALRLSSPLFACHVLLPNLIKQNPKHQRSSHSRLPRHRMPEQNTRNTNRNHLPGRHNHRKHDGSKLLNRCVNKQLSRSRSNRRDDVVLKHGRIDFEKLNDFGNIPVDDQSRRGHDDRRAIDTQHHLIGVDVGPPVLDVDFILPLAREAIEADVHAHEEEADDFGGGIAVGTLAGDAENGHAHRDQEGLDVLGKWVTRPF